MAHPVYDRPTVQDLLEQLRSEFHHVVEQAGGHRRERDNFEDKLSSHAEEVRRMKFIFKELELRHKCMRMAYEEENQSLKDQLKSAGIHLPPSDLENEVQILIAELKPKRKDVQQALLDRERGVQAMFHQHGQVEGGDADVFDTALTSGGRVTREGWAVKSVSPIHIFLSDSAVCAASFSNDGSRLAIGGLNHAKIFELSTGDCVGIFPLCVKGEADDLAASSCGEASARKRSRTEHALQMQMQVVNGSLGSSGIGASALNVGATRKVEGEATARDAYVRTVCFSADDGYLFVGGEDATIQVYDIHKRQHFCSLRGHRDDVYGAACSPNNTLVASTSSDATVTLWSWGSGAVGVPKKTLRYNKVSTMASLPEDSALTGVAFSADSSMVIAGTQDAAVVVWNSNTGEMVRLWKGPNCDGHTDTVYSVAASPTDPNIVASSSLDGKVKIWRHGYDKCVATLAGHDSFVLALAFTKDGRFLLSGSKDHSVILWECATWTRYGTIKAHSNSVIGLTVAGPDVFCSAGGDMKARVWKIEYA